MFSREILKQRLDTFTDDDLRQIADFMEFLKFRAQNEASSTPLEDTPAEQVLSDFRQAWQEAMTEQGIPVSQLWAELANE
jgi:glutamine synthetase